MLANHPQQFLRVRPQVRGEPHRRQLDFPPLPSGERALLRTKEGVILFAFLNRKELVFKWDDKKGGPQEGCRVPVYLSRSDDDGRTWAAPVLLQEGWCGAVYVASFVLNRLTNGYTLLHLSIAHFF